MTSSVQFLGLCRFSVPSEGGFQSQPGTIEDVRSRLYAPERLDQRLAWFEHVTLPGLRGQTSGEFTLVLMIGEDLPEPWRSQLLDLVAGVPQIRVATVAPGPHREACAAVMQPLVDPAADVLVQFRLDDDDALAFNFIRRARTDLKPLLGLLDLRQQFAVDYAKGFVLRWTADGLSAEPRYARQWTPGLLHVSRPALGRFILDMDHSRMWWHMPVLSWTDEFLWIRGAHGGNDSKVPPPGREEVPLEAGHIDWHLGARFGIDQSAFARRLLDIQPDPA